MRDGVAINVNLAERMEQNDARLSEMYSHDLSDERISAGIATIKGNMARQVAKKAITEDARDQDDMVQRASRIVLRDDFAKVGQRVIIVAGIPLGTPGATNMVRIAFVGAE